LVGAVHDAETTTTNFSQLAEAFNAKA